MSAPAEWVSLTSLDLLVSVRVPRGWEVEVTDAESFRVRGERDGTGRGPTLAVQAGRPEQQGHAWFEQLTDGIVDRLGAEVPGFELIGTDRFRLSSRSADVFLVHARSVPETVDSHPAPPLVQVQAWVWAGSHRMLLLGGSTTLEHEQRDLPVLDAIIASLRLLAPLPAG